MNSRKKNICTAFLLAGIVFLGLVLRLGAIQLSTVDTPIRGDARLYFFYAINLKESGVYSNADPVIISQTTPRSDARVPPVFPSLIAATLTDDWKSLTPSGIAKSIRPTLITQAILSTITIILVFATGTIIASRRTGIVASFLCSISPHLINLNIYLLTETVFTFWFFAALFFLTLVFKKDSPSSYLPYIAAGLLLALAALTRPTVQYLPILIMLMAIAFFPKKAKHWSMFFLAFLVITGSWSIRNKITTGQFSDPIAKTATVQLGIYPNLMHENRPETEGHPYRFDTELPDYTSLSRTLNILQKRFMKSPGEYTRWYLVGKPAMFFNWEITPIGKFEWKDMTKGDIYIYPTPKTPFSSNPAYIASYIGSRLVYFPLILLTAAACIFTWLPTGQKLWKEHLYPAKLISFTLVYILGIHMIGAPLPRYAIPFYPIIYIIGSMFALRLIALATRQREVS